MNPSTLEQVFDLRLELRQVLIQLGEYRLSLERLREAEALAERLRDDRRRGQVYAFILTSLSLIGELDEALASGARALAIAGTMGDLRLRILTTTYLAQVQFFRGEYERVIELAPTTFRHCLLTGATIFSEVPDWFRSAIASG